MRSSKKGKEKVSDVVKEPSYGQRVTRGSAQKLLSDALKANKSQIVRNRRKRRRTDIEPDLPIHVVDISIKEEESGDKEEKKRKKNEKRKEKKQIASKGAKSKAKRQPESSDPELDLSEDDEEDEVLGSKAEMTNEQMIEVMKTQKVLAGKVIDLVYVGNPRLRKLVDDLEIQGWNHLFSLPIPVLYEMDVRDFYYNMEITQDGSINSPVNGELIHLNEEILGSYMKVSIEGIKSVAGKQASPSFIDEISKIPNSNKTSVAKKFLKGVYQIYFEFVNKNVLPRTEKRSVATATDLFMIESISKMDEISLPAIMIEHMIKIRTKRDGRHGLAYGYLLGRIFKEHGIRLEKGIKGTMKKVMPLNTLIECECIDARGGKKEKSQISQLLEGQEQLRHEIEELTVLLTQKDDEIVKLKGQIAKSSIEGPGSEEIERLKKKNVELSAKVEDLTNNLLKSHEEADARLSLVLQTFQSRPTQIP